MDVPENAPEECPGTQSESAGKAASCEGCPNQQTCASGQPKAADPDIKVIAERLRSVRHKILILSGKGGVGKSTFTGQLAFGFAQDEKCQVGVMDVDICGPSMPRILGVEGEQVHQSGSGWSPVYLADNICVMSVAFLLASADDAVIWRGPRKNGLIKQFLRDVDWGALDVLLVDTPPGTSDEHLSIVQLLKEAGLDGAVVVTTPQEVALLDVRKEIQFCRKVGVPILGVVENMAGFACPRCQTVTEIFPPTTGGAERMCADMNVPMLARIPLDPRIGQCCDEGVSFVTRHPESPAANALRELVDRIRLQINLDGEPVAAAAASGVER